MAPNTYKVTQYVQQQMTSTEVNLGKLQRGFPHPSHLVYFRISLRRKNLIGKIIFFPIFRQNQRDVLSPTLSNTII